MPSNRRTTLRRRRSLQNTARSAHGDGRTPARRRRRARCSAWWIASAALPNGRPVGNLVDEIGKAATRERRSLLAEHQRATERLRIARDLSGGPRRPSDRDGTGLRGLRERLAAVGGQLEMTTAPGRGFTLTASVPAGARPDVPIGPEGEP